MPSLDYYIFIIITLQDKVRDIMDVGVSTVDDEEMGHRSTLESVRNTIHSFAIGPGGNSVGGIL